ncbi:MAG: TonB-dependent receptor [Treponema sp.]|nr:TonB-dependent receptor [Treponema sp.]
MKQFKRIIRGVGFSVLFSGLLFAQDLSSQDEFIDEDDVIVVSAGKREESISDAVEKVQVLSSDDIKESGAKNLSEAVKNLPGLVIKGPSAGNPTDTISMQGFDSDYVKILIDGISVTGDIGGSAAVFQIPVENIERIEIVQGASSALYGSDAMGGVINIITKKNPSSDQGMKFSASLNEEYTYKTLSKSYRNYSAGTLNFSLSKFSSSLTGAFDWTPGSKDYEYFAFAGGYLDYYKTAKNRLSCGRFNMDWNDWWGKASVFVSFADSILESNYTAIGFDTGSKMSYLCRRLEAGITGEYEYSEKLNFSAFSSVKNFQLETDYEHFAIKENTSYLAKENTVTDSDFIDWESEIRSSWKLNSFADFLFGLNCNLQTVDGDSFEDREKNLLISAFFQDTLDFSTINLSLVPGLRFDFAPEMGESDASFMATPKLSLKYSPSKESVLRFSYGMGYKIPTLKQKYWVFYHNYASGEGNFILNGNPDLESEKSQSVNLSFEKHLFEDWKLNASAYFNYIQDLIDSEVTDANSNPQTRSYVNIGKALTYGGDFSISFKKNDFTARAGYAYTGAKAFNDDQDEWQDLSLRVTHRLTMNISYFIPVLQGKISMDAQWNSRQLLSTGGDQYSPDFLMLSLNLTKTFFEEKLEVYLRADNLLNNLHFMNASDGSNQKEYYNLYDGTCLSFGARIKF